MVRGFFFSPLQFIFQNLPQILKMILLHGLQHLSKFAANFENGFLATSPESQSHPMNSGCFPEKSEKILKKLKYFFPLYFSRLG